MAAAQQNKLWFQSSDTIDRDIRERFGSKVGQAIEGLLDHWVEDASGLVAMVLLLDQFTRNIYRGTERAFSGDRKAVALVRAAVECGADRDAEHGCQCGSCQRSRASAQA